MNNFTLQNEILFLNDISYIGDNCLEITTDTEIKKRKRTCVCTGGSFLWPFEPIYFYVSSREITIPVIKTVIDKRNSHTVLGILKLSTDNEETKQIVEFLHNQDKNYSRTYLDEIFNQFLKVDILPVSCVAGSLIFENFGLQIIKQDKYYFKLRGHCQTLLEDDEYYCANKFMVSDKRDDFSRSVQINSNSIITSMVHTLFNFSKKYHIKYFDFENYKKKNYYDCNRCFHVSEVIDIQDNDYQVGRHIPHDKCRISTSQNMRNFKQLVSLLKSFEFDFFDVSHYGKEDGELEIKFNVKFPKLFALDRYMNRLFDIIFRHFRPMNYTNELEPQTTIFNHQFIDTKTYNYSRESIDNRDVKKEKSQLYKSTEYVSMIFNHVFFYFSRVYNESEHFYWIYFDDIVAEKK